jgi:hypothetical protein
LAENDLKPWRKDMWCIPQVDGEYVARMEDVLDLYAEEPDPKRSPKFVRGQPAKAGATITSKRSSWQSTSMPKPP